MEVRLVWRAVFLMRCTKSKMEYDLKDLLMWPVEDAKGLQWALKHGEYAWAAPAVAGGAAAYYMWPGAGADWMQWAMMYGAGSLASAAATYMFAGAMARELFDGGKK